MKTFLAIVTLALISISGSAFAHGGGTNAEGCHLNHKTGVYHCH